jgi:hypothetical protein
MNEQVVAPISGIWIRWQSLTRSEQVVCASISLIPIWWIWGWKNLFLVLAIGIAVHEWQQFRAIRLKYPSLSVIAVICFGFYSLVSTYFYSVAHNQSVTINAVLIPINSWICFGTVLWYVQDRKIRIRPQVVAWSFSVIVAMMMLMWGFIFFILRQADYVPIRSIYASLTGKGSEFEPGLGNSNYLMPYFPTDSSLPGLVRYVYFFSGPEALALVMAFVCLLALDIKHKLWSSLLFSGAFFILLTSGTRAVWVSLPVMLCLRYLLTAGKVFGPAFICGLLAVLCFTGLTFTPTANLISANARADSTEVRNEIYRLTIDEIGTASDWNLFFGHVVTGKGVLPGYAPAVVGSHSFLLGSLLYRGGLIATGLFFVYWVSLLSWLYKTRNSRPLCLLIFVLFSLTFTTMELEMPVMPISLLCVMMRDGKNRLSSLRYATKA